MAHRSALRSGTLPLFERVSRPDAEVSDGDLVCDATQPTMPKRRSFTLLEPKEQGELLIRMLDDLDKELRNLTKFARTLIKEGRFRDAHTTLRDELQEWDRSPHLQNCLFTLRARRLQAQALYRDAMANRHRDPSLTMVAEARDLLLRNISLLRKAEDYHVDQMIPNTYLLEQCEKCLMQIGTRSELVAIPSENGAPLHQNLSPGTSAEPSLSRLSATWTASQSPAQLLSTSRSNPMSTLVSSICDKQHESTPLACYDPEVQRTPPPTYQNRSKSAEKPPSVCDARMQFTEPHRSFEHLSQGKMSVSEGPAPDLGSKMEIGEDCVLSIQLTVQGDAGG